MHRHVLLIMAVVGLLGGCVSRMTVVPATSSSTGVRYFLPEVFIQVTPNQDGTVTVAPVYLPDPKHEYAIKVDTYLGNHTIDITRTKEGFLDTLTFNSDSTEW